MRIASPGEGDAILPPMNSGHPKAIRRRILTFLYDRYQNDPLDMLSPSDFTDAGFERTVLVPNMHYLSDRELVEMMIGYQPPMFSAVRITHRGIDLHEDRFRFNLEFPASLNETEEAYAELPILVERLVEEADCSALDGEARKNLLRDVQYLRDEFARPAERWRQEVIDSVIGWIEGNFATPHEELPSLAGIRLALNNRD